MGTAVPGYKDMVTEVAFRRSEFPLATNEMGCALPVAQGSFLRFLIEDLWL
jgi:hypothetical protein